MSPKTAVLILGILSTIILLSFLIVLGQRTAGKKVGEGQENGMQAIEKYKPDIEAKKPMDEKETAVENKVQERLRKIKFEAQNRPFTPDEIEFLVNPRKVVLAQTATSTQAR